MITLYFEYNLDHKLIKLFTEPRLFFVVLTFWMLLRLWIFSLIARLIYVYRYMLEHSDYTIFRSPKNTLFLATFIRMSATALSSRSLATISAQGGMISSAYRTDRIPEAASASRMRSGVLRSLASAPLKKVWDRILMCDRDLHEILQNNNINSFRQNAVNWTNESLIQSPGRNKKHELVIVL